MTEGFDSLATLQADGTPPESRMTNAENTRARIQLLIQADDDKRSYKRALVKGLVDGNPPYRHTDLVRAGRSDMCNVNWRIGEAYLTTALAGYYDVFSETPTYATVQTLHGKGQEQVDWSELLTIAFDELLKDNEYMDYQMQCSQYDMVLYGCGPLVFKSQWDWRPYYVPCGMFLVPEFYKSDTSEWEECALRIYYNPSDLYGFIRDEKAAKKAGWDVECVKQSIIFAHPRSREDGSYKNWEFHQQALKNASYSYSAESQVIHCGHYFFREFPEGDEEEGSITHVIVDLAYSGQNTNDYLYCKTRKYSTWKEIIHPMWYDRGGGGYHHSVTGLGVKMFAALNYQNRLLCNLGDKAFSPKLLFRPTTATADEQLSLARFGDYGRLPNGFDVVQTPVNGYMEESLEFNREIGQLLGSNLAHYRRELQKMEGNPITATQQSYMASEENMLGKAQLNRYYAQLTWLYSECYRRAINPQMPRTLPGASAALRFQKKLKEAKVPMDAIKNVRVESFRVAGQGNGFMRRQTLTELMSISSRLPETGQEKVYRDFVAASAGYMLVNRYFPQRDKSILPSDHEMLATLQIAGAKEGVAPVVTETQNSIIYAQMFLHAAAETMASIQKAGPQQMPAALSFLETIGPAIGRHLERLKSDPTRKKAYEALKQQYERMAQLVDKLHKQVRQMQEEQAKQQQAMAQAAAIRNQQDPQTQIKAATAQHDMALKRAKVQNDIALKRAKANQNLEVKASQVRQNMAAKDITVAQEIRNKNKRFSALSE